MRPWIEIHVVEHMLLTSPCGVDFLVVAKFPVSCYQDNHSEDDEQGREHLCTFADHVGSFGADIR